MRWSHCYRLRDFYEAPTDEGGIYEIGTIWADIFTPLYVGRASKSLQARLKAHYCGSGNKAVAAYLYSEGRQRDRLWMHWMKASDVSLSEARLLDRFKIGRDGGLYKFNRRYENGVLDQSR